MSDLSGLERRYRRLLAVYPKDFRREHEQEILSVLMAGAAPGQKRPRFAERVDLLRHGYLTRLRHMRWPPPREYRHPLLWLVVRVGSGLWLLVLTGLLLSIEQWWAVVLLAPAAMHLVLAQRLARAL